MLGFPFRRRIGSVVGILLVASGGAPVSTRADGTMPATVYVRWCPQGLDVTGTGRVRALVADVFSLAAVDISWAGCAGGEIGEPRLGSPPIGEVLVVRIVASSPPQSRGRRLTLGDSLIERTQGTLATVYADRVARLAREAGCDPATLLARAVAHELGHLLLGTTRHSSRGLMRASWSIADLRRHALRDWVFSNVEGRAIRDRIARRRVPDALRASSGTQRR